MGLEAIGLDIDTKAASAARMNAKDANVVVADARYAPLANETVNVIASNLPFGKRFEIEGRTAPWFRRVLGEMVRVSTTNARIALLTSETRTFGQVIEQQDTLIPVQRMEVRMQGMPCLLWLLQSK